jgi:hypothetical protein
MPYMWWTTLRTDIGITLTKGVCFMSTRTFEIYYRDLNDDCKKRYLEFQKVSDASELNEDISPLAMIDVEDEPETLEA